MADFKLFFHWLLNSKADLWFVAEIDGSLSMIGCWIFKLISHLFLFSPARPLIGFCNGKLVNVRNDIGLSNLQVLLQSGL